jgi:hypothetical protein
MEEQFILRVPPSVAERIERLMNESAAASSSSNPEDASLDLSFSGAPRRPSSLSPPFLFFLPFPSAPYGVRRNAPVVSFARGVGGESPICACWHCIKEEFAFQLM